MKHMLAMVFHLLFGFFVLSYTLVFLIRYDNEEINFDKNNVCSETLKHVYIPYISYVYNFFVLIGSIIVNPYITRGDKKENNEQINNDNTNRTKIFFKSWVMGLVALNIVMLFEAYSLLVNIAIACELYNPGIAASGFLVLSFFQFVTIFYFDLYDDRGDFKDLHKLIEKIPENIKNYFNNKDNKTIIVIKNDD